MPVGYRIRERRADDDAALLGIENRAAGLFRDHGYPALADAPLADVAALRRLFEGNRVWVAVAGEDGAPAGYAVAGPLGGFFHLRELSVDPAHGAAAWARRWSGPFARRRRPWIARASASPLSDSSPSIAPSTNGSDFRSLRSKKRRRRCVTHSGANCRKALIRKSVF